MSKIADYTQITQQEKNTRGRGNMTIKRVACYERVSTEEQALRGFSIEAQIAALNEHCERHRFKIVDHYTDAGVSGGKPAFKRPEMSRLLEDVQAGKVDKVLFTRLDRWFRNVKEYFKVQEILEQNNVEWQAIQEDYDTSTPNGEMAITIFLAIAQNERQKGALRVKAVLENKRKNKEACFGGPIPPLGYKKEKDENGISRLVKDPETEPLMRDFWDIVLKYNNVNKAIRHIRQVYGVTRNQKSWLRIAKNEMYCGIYNGVEDYCEPYVTKEDWLHFQENRSKTIRKTKNNRIYLFNGLMRCPSCGHVLCGTYKRHNKSQKEYHSYRCRLGYIDCDYKRNISELKLEKYLLDNLAELIEKDIIEAELEETKPKAKPKYNIPALKEQLRRLEVVYLAGNKSDAEYMAEQNEIKALIAKAEDEAPPAARNLEPLRELLNTDFETAYKVMDAEHRQRFWRSIIDEIILEDNQVKRVKFF